MEIFDITDDNGIPTGETVARSEAHDNGIPHRTAHIWVVRKENGAYQVLLQKRSSDKESFPGMYDTSSAGHMALSIILQMLHLKMVFILLLAVQTQVKLLVTLQTDGRAL